MKIGNKTALISEDTPGTAEAIESNLLQSLREHLPQSLNTHFVLSARNSEGQLIGGLTASSSYGWLLIKVLWVDQNYRSSGIGRDLMSRGQAKGRELDCHSAWLDTSNPDAMQFYAKLGYEAFGELANAEQQHPPGHHRWFMKKSLLD